MNRLTSLAVSIVVGVLTLSVLGQTQKTTLSSRADTLEREVQGGALGYYATTNAFVLSLNRVNAPGGMVRTLKCEMDTFEQEWSPMGAPLRQVLDSLVQTDPRYVWALQNDVVNLFPATGEPPLLQTRITRFRVKNVFSAREALSHLLALEDVRRGMDDLHLKHGVAIIVSAESPYPTAFSVDCKDVTLREGLNAIARAQGRAVWDYIETHCEGRNEVIIRF